MRRCVCAGCKQGAASSRAFSKLCHPIGLGSCLLPRAACLSCSVPSRRRSTIASGSPGLPGERGMGCSGVALLLQGIRGGPGSSSRRFTSGMALAFAVVAFRSLRSAGGGLPSARRGKFDSRAPSFRESDGDCLFRRCCAMFPFADVMHLLAHEFPRLSAGGLAFTRILARTLDSLSFRHKSLLAPEGSTGRGQQASTIPFKRRKHFL
jgi:hypothetical protein